MGYHAQNTSLPSDINMQYFLAVIYDLNDENGSDRANLLEEIKRLGMNVKMSESAYALSTKSSAEQVFQTLKRGEKGDAVHYSASSIFQPI